jgi:hypothetical protein
VLFGIDTSADVLPWVYEEPTPEYIYIYRIARQSFLERIPTMSLLHFSAFKDYLLGWAEDSYRALGDEGSIELVDLTKGRYSPRRRVQKKKLMYSFGTQQILHLLLSAGLSFVMNHIESWEIVDMVLIKNMQGPSFGLQQTLISPLCLGQFLLRPRIWTRPNWLSGKGRYLPIVSGCDSHRVRNNTDL